MDQGRGAGKPSELQHPIYPSHSLVMDGIAPIFAFRFFFLNLHLYTAACNNDRDAVVAIICMSGACLRDVDVEGGGVSKLNSTAYCLIRWCNCLISPSHPLTRCFGFHSIIQASLW
jgi:hypothetical protein